MTWLMLFSWQNTDEIHSVRYVKSAIYITFTFLKGKSKGKDCNHSARLKLNLVGLEFIRQI